MIPADPAPESNANPEQTPNAGFGNVQENLENSWEQISQNQIQVFKNQLEQVKRDFGAIQELARTNFQHARDQALGGQFQKAGPKSYQEPLPNLSNNFDQVEKSVNDLAALLNTDSTTQAPVEPDNNFGSPTAFTSEATGVGEMDNSLENRMDLLDNQIQVASDAIDQNIMKADEMMKAAMASLSGKTNK